MTLLQIDHVPPLFGHKTFNDVASQYGSKSFKKAMLHLINTMRSIADSYLHHPITSKEDIPTLNQVGFSPDMDFLLSEIEKLHFNKMTSTKASIKHSK